MGRALVVLAVPELFKLHLGAGAVGDGQMVGRDSSLERVNGVQVGQP